LPAGFDDPRVVAPGVLAIRGPRFVDSEAAEAPGATTAAGSLRRFCEACTIADPLNAFPLLTLVDDADFTARTLRNWLWVTFTRSNPATDVDGIAAATMDKHWGCQGSLVIDARIKPHHAPPLIEDPNVTRKIDALAARGGPLARYL
jgi:4-hydroxy-3-polyprenylbenzoate decarboxylase